MQTSLVSRTRARRRAVRMLIVALMSLVMAVGSGLALVPRVRLVDVLIVLAGAIAAGAAFAGAFVEFRAMRRRAD